MMLVGGKSEFTRISFYFGGILCCGRVLFLLSLTISMRKNLFGISSYSSAYKLKYYHLNIEKERVRRALKRAATKEEMFVALGSVCNCCGESNKLFLSLDHVKNDGYLERGSSAGYNREKAKRSGWDKTKYQILCYNCNLGKRVNRGICPHQQILTENV